MTERWSKPRWGHGHWSYWFFQPLYRENVHLIWPVTDEQRRAHIEREFGIEPDELGLGSADRWLARVTAIESGAGEMKGNGGQVIAFRQWLGESDDLARLAHEVFHAASNILLMRGVLFGNEYGDQNEAQAYLIHELYEVCCRAMTSVRAGGPTKGRRRRRS